MPRAGLTPDRVVDQALLLVDELGPDRLTLAALADRLGVRQPSLYKHVEGQPDLNRRIAIRAKDELANVLGHAGIGKARADALVAMARAYRGWAQQHPGRYHAAQRPPAPGDADDEAASARAYQVVAAVIGGYALESEDAIDAVRAFRALLHGFVSLEAAGSFALPVDTDRSFDRMVDALAKTLANWSGDAGRSS